VGKQDIHHPLTRYSPSLHDNNFIHTYISDNNNNKYYYTYYHFLLKPRLVFLAWTAKKETNIKYKKENTLSQHGFK
jgi:hypothetical protein